MSTTQQVGHTPGPWTVVHNGDHIDVHSAKHRPGGWQTDRELTVASFVRLEDARLIAAAPELLDALRVVVEDGLVAGTRCEEIVRTAIAKAEGR